MPFNEDEITQKQERFREKWLTIKGRIGNIKYYLNPFTTVTAFLVITAIIVWIFWDDNSKDRLNTAKEWLSKSFNWLYIGQQSVWVILVIYIYFKWGHLKLGKEEDEPEYGNFAYLAMVLSTGLSAAKYKSSVSEVIDHYTYSNTNNSIIYWGKYQVNERAQNALNITLFHWAIHGFAIYTLPALVISFLGYRKGLPITMRTCLYPLIGHKIHGKMGDVIDAVTVTVILLGVSVGLAVSAELINKGAHEFDSSIGTSSNHQIVTTWVLVIVAVISVISGIGLGIKHLSCLTFSLGICIWLVVLFIDNTEYILNVIMQSFGYYIQHIVGTSTHTGAFTERGNLPHQTETSNWMTNNTLFYWGWWMAFAPVTAIFTAKISRGRRIHELIMYSCFLPALLLFLWFSLFGAVALDMQFRAMENGITCNMYNGAGVRIENLDIWNKSEHKNLENLQCLSETTRLFAVMNQYGDVSKLLYVLTMLALILQFITHADSAAFVVDVITSNGDNKPPITQKALWALMQGVVTTAFVKYAGDLKEKSIAIQAAAVIASTPMIIIFNSSCVALWRALKNENEFKLSTEFTEWDMYYGNVNSLKLLRDTLLATIFPWWFLGKIAIGVNHEPERRIKFIKRLFLYLSFAIPFYFWILLLITQISIKHLDKFGWVSLLAFFAYSASYRQILRVKGNIPGNIFEDSFVMIIYPLTVIQMFRQYELENNKKKERDIELSNNNINQSRFELGIENGSLQV